MCAKRRPKWGWAVNYWMEISAAASFLIYRAGQETASCARRELINRPRFRPFSKHIYLSKESFFNPPILRRRFAIPDGILLCKSELGISRGYTSVFAGHSERRFMRAFSAANLRAGLTGLRRRQYNFCKERETLWWMAPYLCSVL